MIDIKKEKDNQKARSFCYEFINSNKPKYIFGRNEFAESIANHIEIDGFIDEFTKDSLFLGKPIINIKNITLFMNRNLILISIFMNYSYA